jgi:hypothetical protein
MAEARDVRMRALVASGAILVLLCAITFVKVFGLYRWLDMRAPEQVPALSQRELPPAPRLQPNVADELNRLRAREDARLTQYGWISKDEQIAHIPIERAIQIVGEGP